MNKEVFLCTIFSVASISHISGLSFQIFTVDGPQ